MPGEPNDGTMISILVRVVLAHCATKDSGGRAHQLLKVVIEGAFAVKTGLFCNLGDIQIAVAQKIDCCINPDLCEILSHCFSSVGFE